MRLEIGEVVDRYVVEDLLGEGGMAVVYRVRHGALGTIHALKLLKVHKEGLRQRLLREGQLQASLRHPHIVAVTDVLAVRGATGLLLEYVHGPTLRELLEPGRLPLADALAIFRGICAGVAHAHHRGLIHRDLKPDNVLMALDGDRLLPKVTDFGLVKVLDDTSGSLSQRTRTGATLGTPAFMSPEQINDASRVDRRADMWSLGCILYTLACGAVPFDATEVIPLFHQIGSGKYTPPAADLPPRVIAAIAGLLQPDPRRRIADCTSLLAYLDEQEDVPRVLDRDFGSLPPADRLPTTAGPFFPPPDGEAVRRARELSARRPVPVEGLPAEGILSLPTGPQDPTLPMMAASSSTWHSPPDVPPTAPSRFVPIVLGAGAVLVAGLVVGLVASDPKGVATASVAEQAPPEPEAAEPEAAEPVAAEPVAAEAEGAATEPPPEGVAPPPRTVAATAPPKPLPPPVEPVVIEEPAPPPASGKVTFEGADALVLVGEDGREVRGPDVPPGSYRVMATFPDTSAPVSAGYVTVNEGGVHHLACVAQMRKCLAR